jgi:hypothetical protein
MSYRTLPTNTRAMPLDCTSKTFVQEYLACRQDPKRSTNLLYTYLLPFFENWDRMISEPDYPKDINYFSLCGRLGTPNEAIDLIKHFAQWSQRTSSVREELELLFFERLRRLRYYPKIAAPAMAEYVIAMDFRNYLKDRIVWTTCHPIDVHDLELTFETEDLYPDHLLLKSLGFTPWEIYLLSLLKLGMTTVEISKLTRLPRKTFSNEEIDIWHKLKQKWHQA